MVDGIARAATDGALLGLGDNFGAALGAVAGADPVSGDFFDYSRSFGERYDENLDIERQKRAAFAEEHPIADTTAKVGGAIGSAVVGAAALPVKAAATGLGRAGQALGGGAVIGGVTGAGEADGPGQSRVAGAGVGAALGGRWRFGRYSYRGGGFTSWPRIRQGGRRTIQAPRCYRPFYGPAEPRRLRGSCRPWALIRRTYHASLARHSRRKPGRLPHHQRRLVRSIFH